MARRHRRSTSGRELVASVVVIFVAGAVWLWIARMPAIPAWAAVGIGFVLGTVTTVSWQRWVARTAYRFGYVKVRGRY